MTTTRIMMIKFDALSLMILISLVHHSRTDQTQTTQLNESNGQISSFPIYGAPMYQQQQQQQQRRSSFDTLQIGDQEYEPTFYRTRNRVFLRDKKKKTSSSSEAERALDNTQPLIDHGRKSSPIDSLVDERASRCYTAMSVESNRIIDSSASTKNGAEFLSVEKISVLSTQFSLKEMQQKCMKHCCDSSECDSSLLSLKVGQDGYRCYLFKCNDRCIYIKHSDYVVLRTRTPEQLDQSGGSKLDNRPMTNQEALNRECHASYEFKCKSDGRCVAIYDVCDGIPHCDDKSDEENCNTTTTTVSPPKQGAMYNSRKKDSDQVVDYLRPVDDSDLDNESSDYDDDESEMAKQQAAIIKHLKELEEQKQAEKLNKKKIVFETDKSFLDSFMKPAQSSSDDSLINTYRKKVKQNDMTSWSRPTKSSSTTKFAFHDNFGMNEGAMYNGGGWSSSSSNTDLALLAIKSSLVRPEDKIYFDPSSSKPSYSSVSLAIILLVLGISMVIGFFVYLVGNTRYVKNRLGQQLNRMRMRQQDTTTADKNVEVDGDYLINGMYL